MTTSTVTLWRRLRWALDDNRRIGHVAAYVDVAMDPDCGTASEVTNDGQAIFCEERHVDTREGARESIERCLGRRDVRTLFERKVVSLSDARVPLIREH